MEHFWMGHCCFGDCFALAAAAHILSRRIGVVKISYYTPFQKLSTLFDNIEWIPKTSDSKFIDIGANPNFNLHNQVSRFYCRMCAHLGLDHEPGEADIEMNVSAYDLKPYISIVTFSNVNGSVSPRTLNKMLDRATNMYPTKKCVIIGWPQAPIDEFQESIDKYNIEIKRVADASCDNIINNLRLSTVVLGPVTGPMLPALGFGLQVFCETARDKSHNFCLEFPSNRPMFFDRE